MRPFFGFGGKVAITWSAKRCHSVQLSKSADCGEAHLLVALLLYSVYRANTRFSVPYIMPILSKVNAANSRVVNPALVQSLQKRCPKNKAGGALPQAPP